MRFEIYKDKKGKWRWRRRASNGLLKADCGYGYATKYNAKRAIRGDILALVKWLMDQSLIVPSVWGFNALVDLCIDNVCVEVEG